MSASFVCAAAFATALHAQTAGPFSAYEHCRFTGGLAMVEDTPLAEGVEGRSVKTVMGIRNVPLAGGTRLLYAYPQTGPFANVKIEQVPADGYTQARQDLVANFNQILTADDSSTRNYALKPRENGLEIYGLDKKKLEGTTLGIYLFFVDRTHTAATIYFLNQDASRRKFSSLEEYASLRDGFVKTMTACAAGHGAPPAAKVASTKRSAHTEPLPAPPAPADAPASAALPNAPLPQTPGATETTTALAPASTDSYVPPEAAPLVHPHNAAEKKVPAKSKKPQPPAKRATAKKTPGQ